MKVQRFRGFELPALSDFFSEDVLNAPVNPDELAGEFDDRLCEYLDGKKKGEKQLCLSQLLADSKKRLKRAQKNNPNETSTLMMIIQVLERSGAR